VAFCFILLYFFAFDLVFICGLGHLICFVIIWTWRILGQHVISIIDAVNSLLSSFDIVLDLIHFFLLQIYEVWPLWTFVFLNSILHLSWLRNKEVVCLWRFYFLQVNKLLIFDICALDLTSCKKWACFKGIRYNFVRVVSLFVVYNAHWVHLSWWYVTILSNTFSCLSRCFLSNIYFLYWTLPNIDLRKNLVNPQRLLFRLICICVTFKLWMTLRWHQDVLLPGRLLSHLLFLELFVFHLLNHQDGLILDVIIMLWLLGYVISFQLLPLSWDDFQ
jgi:hypothetical protein